MKLPITWCLLALMACQSPHAGEPLTETTERAPAPKPADAPVAQPPEAAPQASADQPLPVLGDPLGLLSRPSSNGARRIDPAALQPGKLDPGALMAAKGIDPPPTLVPIERDPRAVARGRASGPGKAPLIPTNIRELPSAGLVDRIDAATGQPRVLLLHASYCPACRQVMPTFVEVVRNYRARGVHFTAASVDREREDFAAYLPALAGVLEPLWVVRGEKGSMKQSLQRLGLELSGDSYGIPLLAVLDRRRKLVLHGGSREVRTLASTLDTLLQ